MEEMSNETRVLYRIKRKRITLSKGEIDTLIYLVNQRLLKVEQLYEYLKSTGESYLKITSYKSKVFKRYINLGLVVPYKKAIGPSFSFNYYRIGLNGLRLLVENHYLPEEMLNLPIQKYSKGVQINHYLATQDIVTHGFSEALKNGIKLESYSAYDFPYYLNGNGNRKILIQPDWILKRENHFINIETDTGTEKLSLIEEKVRNYGLLARENSENQYIVIFSILDDTYRKDLSAKKRRTANMKKKLITMPELLIDNLVIFVVKYSRAMKLIEEVVKGVLPYSNTFEEINVESVATALTYGYKTFPFTFKKVDINTLLPSKSYNSLSTVRCYEVLNDVGSRHYALFTFLNEGNVNHLDRLHYLYSMLKEGKLKEYNTRLIAIYPYPQEINNDILGYTFDDVIFGNAKDLVTKIESKPEFFQLVTGGKMKKISYEETNQLKLLRQVEFVI